ncbi:MAG: hypothetical protein K2W88_03405 [Pararheinheimera sp.]|nr:hypothetical protein [Rheinheimera sp.]
MSQQATEILGKLQRVQDFCITIAALCLMLHLDAWVTELRQTQVSALLGFLLNSAPNLIAAALGPLVFFAFSDRAELYETSLSFGLGLMLYECGQPFISWAVFDWWDLVATLVGTLLSLALIRVLSRV